MFDTARYSKDTRNHTDSVTTRHKTKYWYNDLMECKLCYNGLLNFRKAWVSMPGHVKSIMEQNAYLDGGKPMFYRSSEW